MLSSTKFVQLALVAAALVSAADFSRADVIVVGPGHVPSDIQDAVDAALDGDVLLVRTGVYPSFVIRNKALAVVADTGADVQIDGAVRVGNVASTRTVVLSGLKSLAGNVTNSSAMYGLRASKCAGLVLVQDCTFKCSTLNGFTQTNGMSALVEDSPSVVFSNCVFAGGTVLTPGGIAEEAPPGASFVNSTVSLFETSSTGWNGTPDDENSANGGFGLLATNSFVYASGCTIKGGKGADIPGSAGANGGHGVWLVNSLLVRLATIPAGGLGGSSGCGLGCPAGATGQSMILMGASGSTLWTGAARKLSAPALGREGESLAFMYTGAANDSLTRYSSRAGVAAFQDGVGTLVTGFGSTFRAQALGVIGGTPFAHSIGVPELGAGVDARVFLYEAVHKELGGIQRFGTPRAIVMLDASY